MPSFDYANPTLIPLADMLPQLRSGDVLLYRGYSLVSQWIRMVSGGGPHSHAAMIAVDGDQVDVMEMREFIGGRRLPIEFHAGKFPGQIDVFSIDRSRFPEFDGERAAAYMRSITSRLYGYRACARIALRHLPLVWRMFPISTIDATDSDKASTTAAMCSQAVSMACHFGGGVDPCPRLPHELTEPSHLTRSLLYVYQGTIAP